MCVFRADTLVLINQLMWLSMENWLLLSALVVCNSFCRVEASLDYHIYVNKSIAIVLIQLTAKPSCCWNLCVGNTVARQSSCFTGSYKHSAPSSAMTPNHRYRSCIVDVYFVTGILNSALWFAVVFFKVLHPLEKSFLAELWGLTYYKYLNVVRNCVALLMWQSWVVFHRSWLH